MADAEFALGPNSSTKVLDLNNYGDCNQKDQVSVTFFINYSSIHLLALILALFQVLNRPILR